MSDGYWDPLMEQMIREAIERLRNRHTRSQYEYDIDHRGQTSNPGLGAELGDAKRRIAQLQRDLVEAQSEIFELKVRLHNAQMLRPSGSDSTFTDEEIRQLIMLCHPDRHRGKALAVEITQKLLKLRRK